MAKRNNSAEEKQSGKKLNRKMIENKLDEAFSDFKPHIGKKTFEKYIKKAAKLMSKGFPKKAQDALRTVNEPVKAVEPETSVLIEELS